LSPNFSPYYSPEKEVGGVVKKNGEVVRIPNISSSPEDSYIISSKDLLLLEDPEVYATWHTHPDQTHNLSVQDKRAFLNWPNLKHYVVSKNKVLCYEVVEGEVVCVSE
jgi:proteasome lid subunit RPN8/RPN11